MRAAFYKGTRPGLPGVYNRLIRWWTKSDYSHCELVFGGDIAASSSYMDDGVRFKQIQFDPDKWDFIDLPDYLEDAAWQWFIDHSGYKYDLFGNAHFIVGGIGDSPRKWFCSEAMAAALGMTDPWRYDPPTLFSALENFNRQNSGFFTSEKR